MARYEVVGTDLETRKTFFVCESDCFETCKDKVIAAIAERYGKLAEGKVILTTDNTKPYVYRVCTKEAFYFIDCLIGNHLASALYDKVL